MCKSTKNTTRWKILNKDGLIAEQNQQIHESIHPPPNNEQRFVIMWLSK